MITDLFTHLLSDSHHKPLVGPSGFVETAHLRAAEELHLKRASWVVNEAAHIHLKDASQHDRLLRGPERFTRVAIHLE